MPWRAEDERLLQRLEDELLVERLFAFIIGPGGSRDSRSSMRPRLHPRAAGAIAELRRLPAAAEALAAASAGDLSPLAELVGAIRLDGAAPALLHHLALFHAKVASALELDSPELAATAWVRSLAAWVALAEQGTYLTKLAEAVAGGRSDDALATPEQAPHELVAMIGRRASDSARDLGAAGKAALAALARTDQAVTWAGASAAAGHRLRSDADRRRNAVIEEALAPIGEGLDDAAVRGELASSGRALLYRAIPVWTWTGCDEAVEHFVVDRVDKIGWELYRARNWDALRYLLDPFRPMFDSLARRIESDPTQIAYAASCAQMFVFLAEVERLLPQRLALAERSIRICPVHRNGRLVLAAALCDQAMEILRNMAFFARRDEIQRVEALLERTASLYPETRALTEAREMLARVKKGRIAV